MGKRCDEVGVPTKFLCALSPITSNVSSEFLAAASHMFHQSPTHCSLPMRYSCHMLRNVHHLQKSFHNTVLGNPLHEFP